MFVIQNNLPQRNKANKNFAKMKNICISNIDLIINYGNAIQKEEQGGRLSCLDRQCSQVVA